MWVLAVRRRVFKSLAGTTNRYHLKIYLSFIHAVRMDEMMSRLERTKVCEEIVGTADRMEGSMLGLAMDGCEPLKCFITKY